MARVVCASDGGGANEVGDRGKPGNFVLCFVAQLGHEMIVAQEAQPMGGE